MRRFFSSLVFKISFTIIIIETLALTILGIYYVDRFGHQIDEQVKAKVSIPGTLMNQRALNYDAVQDRNSMQRLIGEEVVEAIILRRDGQVFYASNPNHEDKQAEAVLKDLDFSKFDSESPENRTVQFTRGGNVYFANATPIFSNEKLIGYLYLKIDTSNSVNEKKNIARLFTIGSLLCILLTTFALIALIHLQIGPRISKILRCLQGVRDGNLQSRVAAIESLDEIGELGRNVNAMIVEIENRTIERDAAERTLRESEKKYRQLVENAGDVIFIAQDGMIKFSNRRTSEFLGYEIEELYSIPFVEFIHPDDRDFVVDRHIRRLSGEANLPNTYSFRTISKDKSESMAQLSVVAIEWEGKPATLNFLRDITEQKKLEESLYQAQKFEAIGTLAGGIAHDFNNLLMGIQGRSSLMAFEMEPSHPYFEHIRAIDEYISSATNLTKQLLGVARSGKYEPKPTDLIPLVKGSAMMFGRTKKEIKIQTQMHPSPVVVEVDRQQIEQVLLNMYINAGQAMTGGGQLFLKVDITSLNAEYCRPHKVPPGTYAMVSITDTGIGMDDATRQQIFDPFFTTKEKGRGTGLGLASAYGIIKNHDGIITVNSEVGHGTTFNIYLPLSDKDAYREVPMEGQLLKGSETVLLVDDEEMILEVGQAMLKKLGYRVVVAGGGEQAVAAAQRKGTEIDLVILDLVMPGMDGGKTFDRIKEIRPQIPIILSSGYAMNGQADEIMKRGCNGFIQKPFKLSELSQKARKILDEANNST